MTRHWNSHIGAFGPVLLMAATFGLVALAAPAQSTWPGQQQPARDAALQAPTSTGSISGVVTTSGSGSPVRRARVTLRSTEPGTERSTVTNDEGQFTFAGLRAGRFTLSASKSGYVDAPYGARRPGRPGTPIQLAAGEKMKRADIALPRGGVITGIVFDEAGDPSSGTQVRVLRYVIRTGEKTLEHAGQDLTDDRGIYRIHGLQPGNYLVSALPRNQNGAEPPQPESAQAEQEPSLTYAPVYYPGTPSPSAASRVSLAIGEELAGVDFLLSLVATAKVEGVLQCLDGNLPPGTLMSLLPTDQLDMPPIPGASTNRASAGPDGRFVFHNVPPGQYRVMARASLRAAGEMAHALWGYADVFVTGQDVQGVTVPLQPGMTVTGSVRFESSTLAPPRDLSRVRVSLTPRGARQGSDLGGLPPAQVDAAGRFTITGVPPGRYSISANASAGSAAGGARGGGAGGQWALKSAIAMDHDVLDVPLVIEPNQYVSGALLTFVDRNQEVSGTIQDILGRPTADYTIVLFAADRNYWVPLARRIQAVRPGTDGRFMFRDIPAGEYRLTAVTDVEPGEWFDQNFLDQIVKASIPVSVREGERKVQDIRVAGGSLFP